MRILFSSLKAFCRVPIKLEMFIFFKQLKSTLMSVKGLVRPHRLKLPRAEVEVHSEQTLAASEIQKWIAFYSRHSEDKGKPTGDFPFFYFEPACAGAFHQVMSVLGVNFRHVLNLESAFEFREGFDRGDIPNGKFKIKTNLLEIFEYDRKRRFIAVLEASVFDSELSGPGTAPVPVLKIRSSFLIKNVPVADAAALRSYTTTAEHGRSFSFSPKQPPQIGLGGQAFFKTSMLISSNMGLEYGLLSGDMNLVHTSPLMCRLFGFPKPFIQGFCIANYAIYKLGKRESAAIRNLKIQYCRPIVLDQAVELRYDGTSFEVIDSENQILAKGSYTQPIAQSTSVGLKAAA